MNQEYSPNPHTGDSVGVPPPLPAPPSNLWLRMLLGFLPAASLLGLLATAVICNPRSETLLAPFIFMGIAVLLVSPPVLIAWSSHVLNRIHGPAAPGQQGGRIGLIALVTMGMCVANFVVVFAGCSAILITMG